MLAIRSCISLYSKVSNIRINLEKSVVIKVENAELDKLKIRQLRLNKTVTYLGIPFMINVLPK